MKPSLIGAILALGLAHPAVAQGGEPTPEQIAGAVRYALPSMLQAVEKSCAGELSAGGYLATNFEALTLRFEEGREDYWPQAKSILGSFSGDGKDDSPSSEFNDLPDEALRPFVDGIIVAKLQEEIKPRSCGEIERVLELLDPLPLENLTGLVATIIALVEKRSSASVVATNQASGND